MSEHEMDPMEEPEISPAMRADLEALMRGGPLPDRGWDERPWRVGEHAWVTFAGKGGDVHIYPCVVARYEGNPNEPGISDTPMDFVMDAHDGEPMLMPHPQYARVIRAEPRDREEVIYIQRVDAAREKMEAVERAAQSLLQLYRIERRLLATGEDRLKDREWEKAYTKLATALEAP